MQAKSLETRATRGLKDADRPALDCVTFNINPNNEL